MDLGELAEKKNPTKSQLFSKLYKGKNSRKKGFVATSEE